MRIDPNRLRSLVKAQGLPNTKLAAQAGITRQALQAILREDGVVEVRDRTVRGLVRALRLANESLLSPDPLAGFKQAVADEHADLTFRGLGLPTVEPRSMDEIYVSARVVPVPEPDHEHDCQSPPEDREDESIDEMELTVGQCLALHRRVLLRGEPGSGKTTILRHAARAHALGLNADLPYPKPARVPLLVRLADFAKARERDGDTTLVHYVVARALRDAPANYARQVEQHLEGALKDGGCLVLLDGLDEVGGDQSLAMALRDFIETFSKNQFVITGRVVGLDAGPWQKLGFYTFQVARWREEDIREFARRWYAGRPVAGGGRKRRLEQQAEELTGAILGHPPLPAIASNPLMLTILAALHHANAALPRRRVDLYGKIVEVMLETWEASKRDARPGDPLHGIVLEAREFGWLLERTALTMQREGGLLRPRWWVSDAVQDFLRGQMALEGEFVKEQTDRIIRYLCERTGLLVERGDGIFGFYHRTFQEYFAARGLLLEVEGGGDILALLRPHLFHPQWEEVVVHVAASLPPPRATALLRLILDDPDPAGRFLRRGQLLAMRCLADGTTVSDRALIDQIFSDGNAIGSSRWLGITIRFQSLLKEILPSRYGNEAARMRSEIDEASKSLPELDYAAVYLSSHDSPAGPRDGAPGTVCRRRLGGRLVELVWPARWKRIEDPDSWYDAALGSVRDPKTETKRRIILICLLGEEADTDDRARAALKELLVRDRLPEIRAQCAEALQGAVPSHPALVKLLLDRLEKDKSDVVRARCAQALRCVAPDRDDVRRRLESCFASGPDRLRAGAARGLSQLDFTSPEYQVLLDRFLATIASPAEASLVRCACFCAIAALVGTAGIQDVDTLVEACLDDPDAVVQGAALHVLADAIAEGRKEAGPSLIEKVETMLMADPAPCPHFYGDLLAIVALKEVQGGRRLERVLADALEPYTDAIAMAFIFGSVARLEQVRDSDIDLMVIGDVRLKDLAVALHPAEQTLGRTINPVLFSWEKFRTQYREGNPFLLDVVRKEKIFLKGSRDELTELVADRSAD